MRTVAPGSAVPLTAGVVLVDGDAGVVEVIAGVAGAMLSCTYVRPVAVQGDALPAASVAVAKKVVDEFGATVTPIAKLPPEAMPVATAVPGHPAALKSRTVAPGSAVPFKAGVVLELDGEAGVVPVKVGAGGATLSCTYVAELVEQPDELPAASVADA